MKHTRVPEEERAMAFSMAGGGPSHPEINVTPLIDVLLVLIIIFMIVVTQQERKGLQAEIPEPQSARGTFVDRTIVIQVMGGAKDQVPDVKINQETVAWDQLAGRLREIYRMRADRVAFVRSEDDVDFQYVADAVDIAREAGVEKVGLLGERQ